MTYGTSAYAASRLDELHRAGTVRRQAALLRPAREERIGLVMAFMRRNSGPAPAVSARPIAPAPGASHH